MKSNPSKFSLVLLASLALCARALADPISQWSEDSNGGFSLHLTGKLTQDESGHGQLWGGSLLSPTGDWSINYGGGFLRRESYFDEIDSPVEYLFVANIITCESLSLDRDLRLATGGGYAARSDSLSWGSGNGWAMIMGDDSDGWMGSTYITFTSAADLLDFSTWEWEANIYLQRPGQSPSNAVPDTGASSLFLLGIGLVSLTALRASGQLSSRSNNDSRFVLQSTK